MRIEKTGSGPPFRYRVWPALNELVPVIGGYSEVVMHFRLAGKPIHVAIVQDRLINGQLAPLDRFRPACQVYVDGQPFSSTITPSEGGFYEDSDGYYTYIDEVRMLQEEFDHAQDSVGGQA